MKKLIHTVLIVIFLSPAYSCGGGGEDAITVEGDTLTHIADLLRMVDYGDYIVADVRNPWADSTSLLARYVLAPRDYKGALPEGTEVRVPIERSVVYSGVYGGAIVELGAIDAISGVADGQYFKQASIAERIRSGRITDVGNSQSPSVEGVVDLDPEAIIMSPYQNMEMGAVEKLGIPIIQFVDYMESDPLGRAEWIKLIGVLYGQMGKSDSIYNAVTEEYNERKALAGTDGLHPVVLVEQPMSGGTWDVPAGESYMAQLIKDAGGLYPWAGTSGAGSLKLDAAAVLDRASDADVWIIRSYGPLTLESLGANNPLSSHIRAFRKGNVWICDTSVSPLFDEFPFHPERLLNDYMQMIVPDADSPVLTYFKRAE